MTNMNALVLADELCSALSTHKAQGAGSGFLRFIGFNGV